MSLLAEKACASAARPGPAGPQPTGRLSLAFARDPDGVTYLRAQHASHPFHVCRAQYLDKERPGLATLYSQSSSGGIYANDRHEIAVTAEPGAELHLTTQASTIVHAMRGRAASQHVSIAAEVGAYVEYLPDPQILFPTARFASLLEVRAAAGARLVLGDAFLTHDPSGGSGLFDRYRVETRISTAEGRLLALDRFTAEADHWRNGALGVMGGFRALGTLLVVGARDEALLGALRESQAPLPGLFSGVSLLPNDCGVLLRVLAEDGVALKSAMLAGWRAARRAMLGADPAPRRK